MTRPTPLGLRADDEAVASGPPWATPAPSGDGLLIHSVAIDVFCSDVDLLPKRDGAGTAPGDLLCDFAFGSMDGWVQALSAWVEVTTAQDLNWEHPRAEADWEGAGLRLWVPSSNGDLAMRDRSRITFHMDNPKPASRVEWAVGLRLAGRNVLPPAEHILMRDARAAWTRQQWRRMILDASTACEIAMAQRLVQMGHVDPAKRLPTLAALTNLSIKHGLTLNATRADLENLRKARNAAAHTDQVEMEVSPLELLNTAQQVIDAIHPLKDFVADHLPDHSALFDDEQ